MEDIRRVIWNFPAIDNHAHNLLRAEHQNDPERLLSVTSEAQGDALRDSIHGLAHMAARRQLKDLYGCAQDDWRSLMKARSAWLERTDDLLYHQCLKGIHTVLIDDGLDADTVHPFDWHSRFTVGQTRRIVRIEAEAETIMRENIVPTYAEQAIDYSDVNRIEVILRDFEHRFGQMMLNSLEDKAIVGFKSVICYRSGLAVDMSSSPSRTALLEAFAAWLKTCTTFHSKGDRPINARLDSKPLNDWLLVSAMSMISGSTNSKFKKPIQFHTGLGDSDIQLALANPAHLQSLITHYPQVPVVLLHASYPYTREAGYLATVYSNVYLDLGLVFPMVSRAGQNSILSHAFELTPANKLLYSSDGHWFPETYYLAFRQFREALEQVLISYVKNNSLSTSQAIKAAKDILFENSNELYSLGIEIAAATEDKPRLTDSTIITTSEPVEPGSMTAGKGGAQNALEKFLEGQPHLAFVFVQWFDYMGTMRVRILPIEEFRRVVESKTKIGVSQGNTGSLQNDTLTEVVNTTGVFYIVPDLNSLRPTHRLDTLRDGLFGEMRTSATVMASWCDENGLGIAACPRKQLLSILGHLRREFGVEIKLGFEIEVTFLDRENDGSFISPVTQNHAWGTLSPEQWHGLGTIRDIYDGLKDIGVEVQQMHAESGKGQYEFILPPASAIHAIDTLLQSRQVIRQIAYTRGLRATLHPGYGNGAHVHMSLNQTGEKDKNLSNEWSFFAGVLEHMKAIAAFTLPEEVSYSRVADNHWAGGRFVAWGTQNRETPLRRVTEGRWEYRALDGMANVYLALAAVMGAGLLGLREGMELKLPDCAENPGKLTDTERAERGIVEEIPTNLETSLTALANDPRMRVMIGEKLVDDYILMKRVEAQMLAAMSEEDRHDWLVERY